MRNGWVRTQLSEVCAVQSGAGFPDRFQGQVGNDIPFYKVSDMNIVGNEREMTYENNSITNDVRRELGAFLFPKGSTIFPKIGGAIATNKKRLTTRDCCVDNNVMGVVPQLGKVDSKFLFYFFLAHDLSEFANEAHLPSIKKTVVESWPITLPVKVSEQQRIVGILDEAIAGIAAAKANAEKNLQNARAIFESHLQSVFAQRGEGWVKKSLAEICTFSSGGTPAKDNSSYWSGEIPWVSGRDMKSTRLSDSALHVSQSAVDESSTRMAPRGSLLILVRGMGLAHGAQIAELMVPCAFNQDIRGIHPQFDLLPRYLLFALRDRINSSSKVMSNAAHGTLKIDSDGLNALVIPVPSYDQQKTVVTTIDSLSEETQRLESLYQRKLAALDALKQSLLHQAFSGQL